MLSKFAVEHPTGIGTVLATALILIIDDASDAINWDATETGIVIAAVAGILSLFSPRFRQN